MEQPNKENRIEKIVAVFFQKMGFSPEIKIEPSQEENGIFEVKVKIDEPQILIGEKGQTLNEIQRVLARILNKNREKIIRFSLDINDYKKKKNNYLKNLARELANEAVLTKEEKVLSPMPAYERRIIHLELSQRNDVITESRGEEPKRRVVIKPR